MKPPKLHFISGLPRSGSTLLAALLDQNPRFNAGMTSPVGSLVNHMVEAMSEEHEYSVFLSSTQKRDLLTSIFTSYYQPQAQAGTEVIFDTNRIWCSKLPLVRELYPAAKIICCVRNVAWIMDSIERLVRRNVFDASGLFNNASERATVYSRTEALSGGGRLVGFAHNALREAFYSDASEALLLVDYDLLAQKPAEVMGLIYNFLGEEYFPHDYNQVEYQAEKFDQKLNTAGLHQVRPQVTWMPRATILPPDLFEQFDRLSFWQTPAQTRASIIMAPPAASGL
jgi:sulfotransferase